MDCVGNSKGLFQEGLKGVHEERQGWGRRNTKGSNQDRLKAFDKGETAGNKSSDVSGSTGRSHHRAAFVEGSVFGISLRIKNK